MAFFPTGSENRISEFGTTSRLINLLVLMQIGTIIISRGDMIMLGEAYAFGVVWSFAMKALSVLVLRFKNHDVRGYKVPFNIRIAGREIPIGLALITIALFLLACINVVTKQVATISGSSFHPCFFHDVRADRTVQRRRQNRPPS